jgi:hypothetical protein
MLKDISWPRRPFCMMLQLSAFGIALSLFSSVGHSSAQSIPYFPASEFHDLPPWDKDEAKAWSEILTAFREPGIAAAGDHAFVIRIVVFPAVSNSTVVRLTENDNGKVSGLSKQLWVRLKGSLVEMPISVGGRELASLKSALEQEDFWTLTDQESTVTSDGVDLLLEVNDHGRYHAVISSGAQKKSVVRLARMMLNLAHLHLPGE